MAENNVVYCLSGNAAEIQNRINQVITTGGTVYVPEGDWQCDQLSGGTIFINPQLLPKGAWLHVIGSYNYAMAQTNHGTQKLMPKCILRSTTMTGNGRSTFQIGKVNQLAEDRHVHIGGFGILGTVTNENEGNVAIWAVLVDGLFIENCVTDSNCGADILTHMCNGLISHCDIDQTYSINGSWSWGYGIQIAGDSNVGFGGYGTWADFNLILGKCDWTPYYQYTAEPMYIEHCTFNHCRHAIASAQYSFFVSRFNKFETPRVSAMSYVDIHGVGYPSGRGAEVYNNEFHDGWAIGFRGGGGVVFQNTFINCVHTVSASTDGGTIDNPENVRDLWVWNNTYINSEKSVFVLGLPYVAGTHYFSDVPTPTTPPPPRPNYTALGEHPFTSQTQPPPPPPPPPAKTVAARSYGGLGLPANVLYALWRLRERSIKPEIHKKIHPLI